MGVFTQFVSVCAYVVKKRSASRWFGVRFSAFLRRPGDNRAWCRATKCLSRYTLTLFRRRDRKPIYYITRRWDLTVELDALFVRFERSCASTSAAVFSCAFSSSVRRSSTEQGSQLHFVRAICRRRCTSGSSEFRDCALQIYTETPW